MVQQLYVVSTIPSGHSCIHDRVKWTSWRRSCQLMPGSNPLSSAIIYAVSFAGINHKFLSTCDNVKEFVLTLRAEQASLKFRVDLQADHMRHSIEQQHA